MCAIDIKKLLISAALLLATTAVHAQRLTTCSGPILRFPPPFITDKCISSWSNSQRGETKTYPNEFDGIKNKVDVYHCPARDKRVIISNGIPDHNVVLQNVRNIPCEVNWAVELPLHPKVAANQQRTEIPIRGMIVMATNGVPAYNAQENDYLNAVEGGNRPGAQFWYGHAGGNSVWHVHNPQMGRESWETADTLLGYAMDGFPVYGHVSDEEVSSLDPCNGLYNKDGQYQYHVRTLEQVDASLEYCNGNSPETNWNYILGCYSGFVDETSVYDSTNYVLDDDCALEEDNATMKEGSTASAEDNDGKTNDSASTATERRPNIIILQPDDLPIYDEWGRPPNNPNTPNRNQPLTNMPHSESLRLNGLQMMEAYTTSPSCGTSRFSTITGRYPSRALSNTDTSEISNVVIPTTKLEGTDCTSNNIAAVFKENGYRTAMFGKWHLSDFRSGSYTYESAVETVKACGFDSVGALYIENLNAGVYSDGSFSHNMEVMTHEALKTINEESEDPFFMYFNPTLVHSSADIRSALTDFSCRDTPSGKLEKEPIIPGLVDAFNTCAMYRQTIFDRAESDDDLGPIWIDDSVGVLLTALEKTGQLDNTIFLFQTDQGMSPKGALYEGGIRIAQFIHYPAAISAGSKFNSPVSVLDIGPTMFEFAGITSSYEMDGSSWKGAIADKEQESSMNDRCLYFELERDRAVRCGCFKYLQIHELDDNASTTFKRGNQRGYSTDESNLFDLCNGGSEYNSAKINGVNSEASDANIMNNYPDVVSKMEGLLDCHVSEDNSDCDKRQSDEAKDDDAQSNSSSKPSETPPSPSNRPLTTTESEGVGSESEDELTSSATIQVPQKIQLVFMIWNCFRHLSNIT